MNKRKVNKILKLINRSKSPKITIEYVQSNLKITRNEIIEVFDILIADKKATEYYTLKEKSILKIKDVDYSNLSNTSARIKQQIDRKKPIIIITVIGSVIGSIVGILTILKFILGWI
jgi:hypothetical protein